MNCYTSEMESEIELVYASSPSSLEALVRAWSLPPRDRHLFIHGAYMMNTGHNYELLCDLSFLDAIATTIYRESAV